MYETWTPNQKKRWVLAWLTCAAIFTTLNIGLIILMGGFPDLDKQVKMLIEISISLPIAALATIKIYRQILLYIFPDD